MIRRFFRMGPPVVFAPGAPPTPGPSSAPPDDSLRDALRAWLGRLELREAFRGEGATLVSLELAGGAGRAYPLLHEALGAGSAIVNEVGAGTVNTLSITNKGGEPVLVLEGEIVVGAKQNRTITETLLVAAGATVPVRVGCVEQGRWDAPSAQFRSGRHTMDSPSRRAAVKEVAAAGIVNQARLWSHVKALAADYGSHNSTADYEQTMARPAGSAERETLKVAPSETRVGMMVLLDGRFIGVDVVSHPNTWNALAPRLLPSYFVGLDVVRRHPELLRSTAQAPPAEWLGYATLGDVVTAPTAGLGRRILVRSGALNGAGLWHEDHPAHLAVFAD
jgi:hypothetical protein